MMLTEIATTEDRTALTLIWEDGRRNLINASDLRDAAQDALSRRERIDTGGIRIAPDLTITALNDVGRYGINVHFSDGHERAIYPIGYLQELAERFDK